MAAIAKSDAFVSDVVVDNADVDASDDDTDTMPGSSSSFERRSKSSEDNEIGSWESMAPCSDFVIVLTYRKVAVALLAIFSLSSTLFGQLYHRPPQMDPKAAK